MAKIKQFKAFTNIFVALKKTGCMLKTLTLLNSVKECKMFPSSHHRRYYCEGNNNTWVSDSEVCNSVKDCPGGDDECQGCHNRYHKVLMCKVPLSKIPLFKVPLFKYQNSWNHRSKYHHSKYHCSKYSCSKSYCSKYQY